MMRASICNGDWRIVRAMKKITHAFLTAPIFTGLMVIAPSAGAQSPSPPPPPGAPAPAAPAPDAPADTSPEHTSYLFGLTFGEQLHTVGISKQVDQTAIARGIKEGLEGKKSTRTDQQQIQAFVRGVMSETLAQNKQAAKDFLAKNGTEKGVKTTADGLEYKVLAAGNTKAAAVQPTDEVTVQYRGKLLDGSEFDSSYSRPTPTTFKVNGVIKGWQEALVLMKPGAKWELFVPPELAYDASPRPGIPAGSLLIFEVELVSVKPGEPPPAAASPQPPRPHPMMPPPKPAGSEPATTSDPATAPPATPAGNP
jgi:FKBP-type peptidyl-prolyl cis-trans isomerase